MRNPWTVLEEPWLKTTALHIDCHVNPEPLDCPKKKYKVNDPISGPEEESLTCDSCTKSFKNKAGLITHSKFCKGNRKVSTQSKIKPEALDEILTKIEGDENEWPRNLRNQLNQNYPGKLPRGS